ncbi:hypothetical protein NVP1101O_161 [Vibrio phage 1.101.O._10N.261.45.C6]|nr:hypothetical protein NVP1101O_161 [Vibrio phage 1.101.O._10N.261.45.C6]
MSTFNTIPETTSQDGDDLMLVGVGGSDFKQKRSSLREGLLSVTSDGDISTRNITSTGKIKVNNVEGLNGGLPDNLNPVTASAWVNFNGTGVVSIRDSFNVSSVTDKGTGSYGVNYLVDLQNVNYSVVSTAGFLANRGLNSRNRNGSGVELLAFITNTGDLIDIAEANVIVFGGL